MTAVTESPAVPASGLREGADPAAVIRRNVLLLAMAQALVGIGQQLVPALGAIIVVQFLGSAALAGLATALLNLSRFVVAYPVGWLADTLGRRAPMVVGHLGVIVGSVVVGLAVQAGLFPVFVGGLLLFGVGAGAVQQLRLAAADMFPPSRRAQGLGYVLTGSLVGAIAAPLFVSAAQWLGPEVGLDPLGLAWLMVPLVAVPSLLLVTRIRPDPRDIAANLAAYYPGYRPPPARLRADGAAEAVGFRAWIRQYRLLAAFVASFGAQGTMTLMMAMTSLALWHHDHAVSAISLSVAIHVFGMFAFSVPMGRLADRFGRRPVLLLGLGLLAVGSVLVGLSSEYVVITAGTFFVGLGWSGVSVASTALIADAVGPRDRGRAIGTSDTFSGGGAIVLPLLGGPLVEQWGLPVLAYLGVALMAVPFALALRLREPRREAAPRELL